MEEKDSTPATPWPVGCAGSRCAWAGGRWVFRWPPVRWRRSVTRWACRRCSAACWHRRPGRAQSARAGARRDDAAGGARAL